MASPEMILRRALLTLVALALWMPTGAAGAGILIPAQSPGEIRIQQEILLLKDETATLTIQDVAALQGSDRFRPNSQGKENLGYSKAAYWLRISIAKDPGNYGKWALQVRYPHLDRIEFYGPGRGGPLTPVITGDTFPFDQRPLAHRHFLFPVSPSSSGTVYYLRLASQGAITFPLSLVEMTTLHEQDRLFQIVAGLYFGALIFMVAYNLLFLIFVRERLYLYYACFILLVTLHQLIWFGLGFEYLWPSFPALNNRLDLFAGSGLFFFIGLFAMDFLETRRHLPRVHRLLWLSTAATGIAAVLAFLLDRQLILAPFNNLNIIQMLLLLLAGLLCFIKRIRQGYIFLLAWSMALLGGLALGLYKANLLPDSWFWSLSVQVGILSNVLLISLGLADRINQIKKSLDLTRGELEKKNLDLTQAVARLETSEKRFRDLANLLPQTVFELDLEGRITFANEQGKLLTGYTEKDFSQGLNITALFDPRISDRIREDMDEVLTKGEALQREYQLTRKDKRLLPVLCWASPIFSGTGPTGIRGIALDLSERKKTEEIMIQTEKMMSLGGLAAGMAHEINNPLAGMIQNAQVLENRLTKPLPANIETAERLGTTLSVITQYMEERGVFKLIQSINQAGMRASKITQNMLSFARKGDADKHPCNLSALLDDTIDLAQNDYALKKKFSFREVEIIREYDPNLPLVSCEPSKIQQVVFNLIKNASQAMADQKTDHRPRICFSLSTQPGWAVIDVTDNGPGMDEKTQEQIFKPFFTTKGLENGTGLGLSVSRFIVEDDHGGEIQVLSTPGQGTTFTIRLPI